MTSRKLGTSLAPVSVDEELEVEVAERPTAVVAPVVDRDVVESDVAEDEPLADAYEVAIEAVSCQRCTSRLCRFPPFT